jgi:hypothetical protein
MKMKITILQLLDYAVSVDIKEFADVESWTWTLMGETEFFVITRSENRHLYFKMSDVQSFEIEK